MPGSVGGSGMWVVSSSLSLSSLSSTGPQSSSLSVLNPVGTWVVVVGVVLLIGL
jgi:hypothetical protein